MEYINKELDIAVDAAFKAYCDKLKQHPTSNKEWAQIRGYYQMLYGFSYITDGKQKRRYIKEIDIIPDGWYLLTDEKRESD